MNLKLYIIPMILLCNNSMANCSKGITWYSAYDDNGEKLTTHFYKTIEPENRIVTLMYHDIVDSDEQEFNPGDVSLKDFKLQMEYLKENGYNPISVNEYHKFLGEGTPALPSKPYIVTLDDGYSGNCNPEFIQYLQNNNIPVTFYVHTKYVGVGKNPDNPESKSRCSFEDWQNILDKNNAQKPLFSVQSHTVNHRNLSTVTENYYEDILKISLPTQDFICSSYNHHSFFASYDVFRLDLELFCSKYIIEKNLKVSDNHKKCPQYVNSIAYPLGDYSLQTISSVRQFYGIGFTVGKPEKYTNFNIPRFGVGSNLATIEEFKQVLQKWKESIKINY